MHLRETLDGLEAEAAAAAKLSPIQQACALRSILERQIRLDRLIVTAIEGLQLKEPKK